MLDITEEEEYAYWEMWYTWKNVYGELLDFNDFVGWMDNKVSELKEEKENE